VVEGSQLDGQRVLVAGVAACVGRLRQAINRAAQDREDAIGVGGRTTGPCRRRPARGRRRGRRRSCPWAKPASFDLGSASARSARTSGRSAMGTASASPRRSARPGRGVTWKLTFDGAGLLASGQGPHRDRDRGLSASSRRTQTAILRNGHELRSAASAVRARQVQVAFE
jgi:hypothetical protein